MDTVVGYELRDGVATIAMDDGKANVMSVGMLQALDAAFDRAQADRSAVMLTGRHGMLSGGFDLAVFKNDQDELLRMLQAGALLTERLLACPRPLVAACTGHAIAMGERFCCCARTCASASTKGCEFKSTRCRSG